MFAEFMTWLEAALKSQGTELALGILVVTVLGVVLVAHMILPFAVFGVKSRLRDLTRATNYNTAEIRALRNDNDKRAARARAKEAKR